MNKLLIIDNYDSFTWNIYQYFCSMGLKVYVKRNNEFNIKDIIKLTPQQIVISPGPGIPDNAGISLPVISYFAGKIPILGICLGHQAIGQFFGAKIVNTHKIMHGKVSFICHKKRGLFFGLSQPLKVICYNSLVIDSNSIPSCLEVTAWSINQGQHKEIMAIRHRSLSLQGVQFHPESILTEQGYQLLKNFLNIKNN